MKEIPPLGSVELKNLAKKATTALQMELVANEVLNRRSVVLSDEMFPMYMSCIREQAALGLKSLVFDFGELSNARRDVVRRDNMVRSDAALDRLRGLGYEVSVSMSNPGIVCVEWSSADG